MSVSAVATVVYYSDDSKDLDSSESNSWVDPIVEVENVKTAWSGPKPSAYKPSPTFLQTDNIQLIDYHNLNCDGNEKPPAELDNTAEGCCIQNSKMWLQHLVIILR